MLSDAKIRSAKPTERPYKLTDSHGLYLHVTPAGSRIWRVRYEIAGREQVLTIGAYPAVSLAEARAARNAAREVRRAGRDPAVERKAAQTARAADEANTFEAVARAWYANQLPTWRDRHAEDVITSLQRDVFPEIGNTPIRDLTVPAVLATLRKVEARGAVETAHRLRQRMSAVCVYAIASGIADADPAGVVKGALAPIVRRRQPAIVDLAGVRVILTRAEAVPAHPGTRLALRLLALTAVRGGELRGALVGEFEGLDGNEPIWRIPAERMKADRPHLVPLSRQAVEIVGLAKTLIGRGPLLFPSTRHAHRPMSENALGYLLNRAGYHGRHVPHGFRAAFATIMSHQCREDDAVIDLMLAHAPKDRVAAAYNRATHMERRRQIAQQWADMLTDGLPPAATLLQATRR